MLALLVGGAGCVGGAPDPTPQGSTTEPVASAVPPSVATSASPSTPATRPSSPSAAELDLSTLHWYEVDRGSDTHGNSWTGLLIGRLDGWAYGDLRLVERGFPQSQDPADPSRWTDPNADGIFGGHVIVWGRDGHPTEIEAVDVTDATIAPLIDAGEPVHVATADADLTKVFFVTVDPASFEPTGLWVDDLDDSGGPARLDFRFAAAPVSNFHKYRLIASADGSHVAVQSEEGTITVIDVEANDSDEVRPGGPMLGFGAGSLIALGPLSASQHWPVFAFENQTLERRVLAEGIDSAQVVPGMEGDLVAVMRTDPLEPRGYEIGAVSIETGEAWVVYEHDPAELGPWLPRRDRAYLGAELPADWALLADSFFIYIDGPEQAIKDRPLSRYPRLLNLRTGEQVRVGLFALGVPQ